MGEIVSKAQIFIDFSGGNFQLRKVKSYDVTSEKELEVVNAVGVTGGAGFRKKQGGGEITFDVYRETGAQPEVNYRRLENTDEAFQIVIQDEDGQREQYRQVRVANVARKGDDSGSNMDTVKMKFLRRGDL